MTRGRAGGPENNIISSGGRGGGSAGWHMSVSHKKKKTRMNTHTRTRTHAYLFRPEGVYSAEANRWIHGLVAPAVQDRLQLEFFALDALRTHPMEVVGVRDTWVYHTTDDRTTKRTTAVTTCHEHERRTAKNNKNISDGKQQRIGRGQEPRRHTNLTFTRPRTINNKQQTTLTTTRTA